jgi:hypothetical protein
MNTKMNYIHTNPLSPNEAVTCSMCKQLVKYNKSMGLYTNSDGAYHCYYVA